LEGHLLSANGDGCGVPSHEFGGVLTESRTLATAVVSHAADGAGTWIR
jgi:hypothetical protein